MRMVLLASILCLAACDRGPEPAKSAAPVAAAAPSYGAGLEALVGKYPAESRIFEDGALAQDLASLLGPKLDVLKTNTQTSGPLQKEGGVYYLTGNKQHEGGLNEAYLLVDPAAKAIEVGLRENGALTVYTTPGAKIAKPKDVQTMLANAAASGAAERGSADGRP